MLFIISENCLSKQLNFLNVLGFDEKTLQSLKLFRIIKVIFGDLKIVKMKKIILIVFLFCSLGALAQGKVAEKISELQAQKAAFKSFSVLTVSDAIARDEAEKVVTGATFAKIQTQAVNEIFNNKYETIEVEIPFQGENVKVQLYKVDLSAEGFHVDTDKAKSIAYTEGVHYRGIIKGDMTSLASMNFFNNELNGIVSSTENNNVVIGKLDKPGNVSDYIVYSDAKMKIANTAQCGVKEASQHHDENVGEDQSRDGLSARCVTVYFEIDHNLYLQNGSNTTTTTNWMTSVFNNVQTLYNNDGISVAIKSIFIWTVDDPYSGTGSSDYLNQFAELRPVFDGDIAQLVGIDPGGLGGVAFLRALCSTIGYGYSDINFGFNTVPTYSWTVMVITHEMGHGLGSSHTHSCVWNGNNTAIDNCAPSVIGGDGSSCMTNPPTIPTVAKGTIMSYCHLVGGVGINFVNGFGPQPKAAILAYVNGSTCLSSDCVNTCINTVTGINISTITNNSMTATWTDIGSTTSWQVAVMPYASNFPSWITVSTPTYTVTDLNPNAYYKIRIRPLCTATNINAAYKQSYFATTADWCSGITITDTGGATANYGNLQEYVRTFIPNVPQRKIKLTFTSIGLELDYDYIYVYDGATTSAPDLTNGGLTGTTTPLPFVSSSPDGALTLRFFSDQLEVGTGYVANITCEQSLGVQDLQGIDFTYYPNPTQGTVNIISNTDITEVLVYNPQGRLLYQSANNGLEKKVDVSAFATGTYFFKLKFEDKQANFKIMKN